ncbi:hypothetical protein PMAG_a3153 [Pseudoalteromonas mariniglutinosa NCIMB 1770]|nr:hypothetical protein [Pseudoalteromonas mariniglutinosa NCIMB 1770]
MINSVLALAVLSNELNFLELFFAASIGLHLWLAFSQDKWTMLTISCCSALVFTVFLAAHLLLGSPLYLIVLASIVLTISGYFTDEELTTSADETTQLSSASYMEPAPLLNLPNTTLLRQRYYQWRKDNPQRAALVVFRLEGFAQVNQHIGRDFGDLLLAQSANRIKQLLLIDEVISLAGEQKLAHLGGLNFAFICNLAHQKHLHEQLINQILGATVKPFNVANCTIKVSARASFVDCDEQENSFDNLISFAFLALDSHPQQQVVAYHQQMKIEQIEQQARLQELANIDFTSEFELYFQPIICNQHEKIEFLELLLRWQHPRQGILSANRFIDDIRVAGLAYPLATFVIERAAELAMALRMEGISMPLSINLFGSEMLNEEFIEFIDRIFAEHNLQAGDLIIECPLNLFMSLDEQGKAMVSRINSIGIKVCVDGLGDSPIWLAKLPNLAVEYVKIAPALTADFSQQSHVRSLISGMVDMHNQQNAKVICEGVETREQLNFVKSLNTYAAQGYYFSHPLSSVGMISWLKQWQIEHQ